MKIITLSIFTFLIASSFNVVSNHVFKWQFDKFKKLTYKYRQTVSTNIGTLGDDRTKMIEKLEGSLMIKVKSDTLADVVLGDLKATMCKVDSLGDTTVVMSQSIPDIFIQNLKEDGSTKGQVNGQTEMLTIILFPITNKKMEIGDSADQPVSMPFNVFGSNINVTGYNRIKYMAIKDGIDKLETVINVSDYTIPDDVKTKYTCYMKGNSTFDFNGEKGYYMSGLVNTNTFMGTGSPDSTKGIMNLSMKMNSRITVQLMAAE